jgi:hypothetical protein
MAAFGFGYVYYPEGENLAAGNSDAQSAFNQWLTACDPDASGTCTYAHKMNMLNGGFKAIGIGRAYNASSTYKWYWTTDFRRRRRAGGRNLRAHDQLLCRDAVLDLIGTGRDFVMERVGSDIR